LLTIHEQIFMKYEPIVMIEAPQSIREATNLMKCLHGMMIEARAHARGVDGDVRGVRHVVVG